MTAPVDTTFSSGTTITSNWLNGVNDHVNNLEYKSVLEFGVVGDGIVDDTTAMQTAALWLQNKAKTNVSGVYVSPGATLEIPPLVYKLTDKITFFGNVNAAGASFVFPDTFTGIGVQVGIADANHVLTDVIVHMPEIIRSSAANIRDGSTGARFVNLWGGHITKSRIRYWDTAEHYDSVDKGHVYVNYFGGQVLGCRVSYKLKPTGTANNSFVNENNWLGGGCQQPIAMGEARQADIYSVVMDGDGKAVVNNNRFWGVSLEGDAGKYKIYGRHARENFFYSCRWEQGLTLDYNWFALTVDSATDTFSRVGHGLSNGDPIVMAPLTSPPGGTVAGYLYYVANVTADTFQLKVATTDAAVIDITSAGSSVRYSFPASHYFDGSTYETQRNSILGGEYTYNDAVFINNVGAQALYNTATQTGFRNVFDGKNFSDSGVVAVANRQGASGTAIALYGSDPMTNPGRPLAAVRANGKISYFSAGAEVANFGYLGAAARAGQLTAQNVEAFLENTNIVSGTSVAAMLRATAGPDGSNVGRLQAGYIPSGNANYPTSLRKRSVLYALGSGTEVPDGLSTYLPAAGSTFKMHLGGSTESFSFEPTGFKAVVTASPPSLSANGTMTFELVSDTSLKIKVRGSDGVTRSSTLVLS